MMNEGALAIQRERRYYMWARIDLSMNKKPLTEKMTNEGAFAIQKNKSDAGEGPQRTTSRTRSQYTHREGRGTTVKVADQCKRQK